MKVMPLDGRIGAEVDLDLKGPWTERPADVEELRDAFGTYHLLLFRDPDLAAEDQIRLVEALELVPDEWTNGDRFGFLSNQLAVAPNDGQHNAYLFHSDLMWKDQPINSISLYAMVIPEEPAPTIFASGVGAAADLPQDLRARVEDQEGLFLIDFTGGDKRYSRGDGVARGAPRDPKGALRRPDQRADPRSSWTRSSSTSSSDGTATRARSSRAELHSYLYVPTNLYRTTGRSVTS